MLDVLVNSDQTIEPDETVLIQLSNAVGAPIGDAEGVLTIVNDDFPPTLYADDDSVAEGSVVIPMIPAT